jgi:low temperature requirement protein LtrA
VATEGGDSYEQRVTPLELFFDLVFVFALTQVTGFLADHLTWVGMLQGAALLAVLWSSWAVYSWLTNAVPAEDVIPARIVIFCAMAAMFVASLAVPGAFGQYGVLFGSAYFVVQLSQVVLYSLAAGSDLEQRWAILRLAPGLVGAPVLMIVAGFLDGYAQGALWAAALAVGYGVAFVRGVSGFRIHAGHFAERHGLVVIIALGESIVAAGVGVSGLALGTGVIAAVVVGIALAAALWWAYFDLVMLVAERRLSAAQGEERARLARDSYSYLHLPMVAGIIFVALGVKQTLSHVGGSAGDDLCRSTVWRGRPLPARAQRLQAARGRQPERSEAGGDDALLGAHSLGCVYPFAHHPGRPGVVALRSGRLRDGDLSGVPACAPCTLKAA